MRLLNFLWRKRLNVLIIILTLSSILPAVPVIKNGLSGVFYNIDPEMALIGNALTYTQSHLISYRDHPGTPTILLISYFFTPFRVYTKFVLGENFISWSFDNVRLVFLSVRYLMIFISALSVATYLFTIKKLTKDVWPILFAGLALFSFGFTYRLGGAVLSENLSFLIISVWLLLFTYLLKNPKSQIIILLSLLSGVGVANKYNNFPLVFLTMAAIFSYTKISFSKRIHKAINNLFLVIIGFVVGTFPIIGSYKNIFSQIIKVFSRSGVDAAHGSGTGGIFDFNTILNNLNVFWNAEMFAFVLIILLFFISVFKVYGFSKNRKINFINQVILVSSFLVLISFLFISKYPLVYYQFPNYLIIVFLLSYLFRNSKYLVLTLCLLALPFVYTKTDIYYKSLTQSIENSIYLEKYVKENESGKPTLWDFGYTQDFMLLWMRGWASGIYKDELKAKRSDLLELKPDNQTVYIDYDNYKGVMDVCWDKLYMRDVMVEDFLSKQVGYVFEVEPIDDTSITEITSNHCGKLNQ